MADPIPTVQGPLSNKARQTSYSYGYTPYVLDPQVDPGYLTFFDSADETDLNVAAPGWTWNFRDTDYWFSSGRAAAYLCTQNDLFEYGIGYLHRPPQGNDILYRDQVLLSSNWNNHAVNWPTGQKLLTSALPEHALNGNIVGYTRISSFATQSGTTTLPYNNVKPVQTQGTQVGSDATITPVCGFSVMHIWGLVHMTSNNSTLTTFHAMLFRKVANTWTLVGLAPHSHTGSANDPHTFSFHWFDRPKTTTQVTYQLRVAVSAVDGGTWYINRRSSTGTPPFGSNRLNTTVFIYEHLTGYRGVDPFHALTVEGHWP
jgi:hypothetical protein